MLIGAVQLGLMYLFSQYSFYYLTGGTVALLSITTAIYVPVLNDLIHRKFSPLQLLIALLTLLCTRLAMVNVGEIAFPWQGVLCSQLCNICYVLGQILYRRLHSRCEVRDSSAMAWFYLGAFIALIPTVLICPFHYTPLHMHWLRAAGELFFLGILCCGLGNYLWNRGSIIVNSSLLAICNNLPILFGILFAILFFGEPFGGWQQVFAVGGILGLLFASTRLERRAS
jgi:drug/metabolite transporter (DMT)-like permease